MDYTDLLKRVENVVSPILESLGLELIEREFLMDQGRWVLRLYIDREAVPVTIDDCQTASRIIEAALDVEDLVPGRYALEVSSPGLNRPLRRPKDFERYVGQKVEIKANQGIEGQHNFIGILKGLQGGCVVIEGDVKESRIPLDDIKKARIKYEFK
ncbi:MAG: ribosome maturation factor RimP [Deltaproteobacteria bacterium]|nr:ribosome maturation factor RimP [Deltaproteobacteria bacterium]